MLDIGNFKGAIFDVDDTLLDNGVANPIDGLHERSRLLAVQEVGRRHGLSSLITFSPEENLDCFVQAKVHSLEAAVWNVLLRTNLVHQDEVDRTHPLFAEILLLKNELYPAVLLREGKEIPGASHLVQALAKCGLQGYLAIASSALRQDIDLSLQVLGMTNFFPEDKIVSFEDITNPKPHPEAFDRAFATLGLAETDREYTLAFEDHPRGIAAAKAAGLFTCAITSNFRREQLACLPAPPDLIADTHAEFETLFQLA